MEVSTQIKKYRTEMKLSQDQLAEKIYVTRQTISNWETEKSYPDIHSLLLLSSLFHVSLDQLIKGDIDVMISEVNESEIRKMKKNGAVYSALLTVMILSAVPLFIWLGFYAFLPWGLIAAVTLYYAIRMEHIKKENDVQTYKEIIAFTNGKRLDEIEHIQEAAKRPYQQVLAAILCGVVTLAVCLLMILIAKEILKV